MTIRDTLLVIILIVGIPTQLLADTELIEDFGNFPDAVEVTGLFATFIGLSINGETINATGFLFRVTNTSFGDGFHSAFENDPDGDFATNDVLTPEAAAAIDAGQPYGIYSFGAELPIVPVP